MIIAGMIMLGSVVLAPIGVYLIAKGSIFLALAVNLHTKDFTLQQWGEFLGDAVAVFALLSLCIFPGTSGVAIGFYIARMISAMSWIFRRFACILPFKIGEMRYACTVPVEIGKVEHVS